MSITLTASKTALAPGLTASFLGSGGSAPYVFSVEADGAGGTINASSGVYTAPATINPDPAKSYDTIRVTDALLATTTKQILVTDPLGLVCDIIQNYMELPNGRVYFWDQKINQPKDSDLYVAVSVVSAKPFGNTNRQASSSGLDSVQSVNMLATLGIDIISRGPAARLRKEEVILALNSNYSQAQQEANSFYLGKVSTAFVNLSDVDGAAIPYRFNITVNMQYFFRKVKAVSYFDEFELDTPVIDP